MVFVCDTRAQAEGIVERASGLLLRHRRVRSSASMRARGKRCHERPRGLRGMRRRSPAPDPFEEDFRRLVVRKRLVRAIQAHAGLAADGIETFEQAVGAVMALACGYGAGYLSPDAFANLEHWVLDQLSEVLDQELDR